MPNGKPGDTWYTDITDHRLPTFSDEVDALITELDRRAAGERPYAPWNDPLRQQVERVVDDYLDEIGHETLDERSPIAQPTYRNLSTFELAELRNRLESFRSSL